MTSIYSVHATIQTVSGRRIFSGLPGGEANTFTNKRAALRRLSLLQDGWRAGAYGVHVGSDARTGWAATKDRLQHCEVGTFEGKLRGQTLARFSILQGEAQ